MPQVIKRRGIGKIAVSGFDLGFLNFPHKGAPSEQPPLDKNSQALFAAWVVVHSLVLQNYAPGLDPYLLFYDLSSTHPEVRR
jgi:hypothetical protein